MGLFRNLFRRLPTPDPSPKTSSLGGWLVKGIIFLVLWLLGAGWLYPWVAPFLGTTPPVPVHAPPQPGMEDPVEVDSEARGPPVYRYGWAGPEAAREARAILGKELREFRYYPAEWNAIEGKRVVLWPFVRVSAGRDPPNIPQPDGDCVSRGFAHGAEHAQAVHLYFTGGEFYRVYPPWIYGGSRVLIGKGRLGNGAGSVGAWAAKLIEEYGVLPWTNDLPPYNKSTVQTWGRQGPPKEMLARAAKHKALTRSVASFEAACVAISHGWPVPVCSGQGFRIKLAHERIEGVPSGSWAHCMVFIGFDTREGQQALYCLNSWGPDAHAPCPQYATLDGAPCGGFWVPRATVEGMLAQQDSFSVSFDGFTRPQAPILEAFTVFTGRDEGRKIPAVEAPELFVKP